MVDHNQSTSLFNNDNGTLCPTDAVREGTYTTDDFVALPKRFLLAKVLSRSISACEP